MDLNFFRRSQQRFAGRATARLDYGVLVATLEAMQSSSGGARAELSAGGRASARASRQDGLAELLLGGPQWRAAAAERGGCFDPGCAEALRAMARKPE